MYEKKPDIVTFDLDSTLCDTRHRHHMIDRVNGTDWSAYSKACTKDRVIHASRALLQALQVAGHDIHFVTGRTESARPETEEWLSNVFPVYAGLWMDDTSEVDHVTAFGSHAAYKVHRIKQVSKETGQKVLLHVDDWADVKVALEAAGIPCICVRTPSEIDALTSHRDMVGGGI